MSKIANKMPVKQDIKGPGDLKRDQSGSRNDRDRSRSHSRDAGSRNKHGGPGHSDHHQPSNSKERMESTPNRAPANDEADKNETKSTEEKKFTGRCRLFVGNLTPDVSEDDFKKMFQAYGEVSEVYLNSNRGFGFIRLDYRHNAEAAKTGLDGFQRKGRVLRVRFATHAAALKVKNLHSYVSNELLEQAFTQFGDLERAIVIVDDRGKPTGEGLVEFVRKPGAHQALRRINEGVFLFGSDPKPIEVEPLEQKDEEDGMPEIFLPKNDQYKKEREKDPYFAPHGSFEYEFGMRWKQLQELEKKKTENVKKEMEEARLKLEDEMQNALYDYQAEQIRRDLVRQQEELRRLEELRNQDRMRRQQELEIRVMSRRAEEERERQEEDRRRQQMMMRQQDMQRRSGGPMDAGMSRSREDLMGIRGEGSGGMRDMGMGGSQSQMEGGMRGGRGGAPPMQPPPAPPSGMGLEQRRQQGMGMDRGPQGMGMDRGPQGVGMDRGLPGMDRGGPQGMDRGGPQGMDRGGPQGMDRGGPQGMDRGGPQGIERGPPGMDRGGPQGIERGPPGMDRGPQGMDRGPQGMDRGPQGPQGMDRGPPPGMERGPQGIERSQGMDRGPQGMDRGPQGMDRGPGMERGSQGIERGPGGMDRGPQGMNRGGPQGIERGPPGISRGPPGPGIERGGLPGGPQGANLDRSQPGTAAERGQQSGAMDRGAQQGLGRMGQGVAGPAPSSFGDQNGMANTAAGGNRSAGSAANASIPNLGKIGGQGGPPGSQMEEAEGDSCLLESSPGDDDAESSLGPAAAPEDGQEEWRSGQHAFPDTLLSLQLQPQRDADPPTSEDFSEDVQNEKWALGAESLFAGSFPYLGAGGVEDCFAEGAEVEEEEREDGYFMGKNACFPMDAFANGSADCIDEAHPCHSLQSLQLEKLTLEQGRDGLAASLNSSGTDEDRPSPEPHTAERDSFFTDDGGAPSEAEVSATASLNTSHSASPIASPRPHYLSESGSGSSTASSATGVPLQQGHPGVAPTCYVRVHPMHVAAAVAGQAAAVNHQRNLMAAAVAQQHAAVVARQRMAAAAAVHRQRTHAAMMQQHLVRSRYVGAPVVVRPAARPAAAFVPAVPTVPTPVRVRMRLRRSVMMTEEYSVDRP